MQPAVHMVCEVDQELIDTYPLDELPWKPNPHGVCGMLEDIPLFEDFLNVVCPLFPESRVGFHAISKVIKGQAIQLHRDRHDGNCKTRIHIPLKTNDDAWFYTGGVFHHMKLGKGYVIDPSKKHGAVNLGEEDRIHLIFNMVLGS